MRITIGDNTQSNLDMLGLSWPFTEEDLKSAFRTKAMEYHPDKGGNTDDFIKLKDAFNELQNLASIKLKPADTEKVLLKPGYSWHECEACKGEGFQTEPTHIVIIHCPNCTGQAEPGKVFIKCQRCDNGTYKNQKGKIVDCPTCNGTGLWKKVNCDICNTAKLRYLRKKTHGLFRSFSIDHVPPIGFIDKERQGLKRHCYSCNGVGKSQKEQFNPVLTSGTIA